MSPCENCSCGGGSCSNGSKEPKPGRVPWLALVLLLVIGFAFLFSQLFGAKTTKAEGSGAANPSNLLEATEGTEKLKEPMKENSKYPRKSDEELKKVLTPLQYRVTQKAGTEAPYSNEYDHEFRPGIYVDVTTGEPLFLSNDKYNSGCGWPAFSKPIREDLIAQVEDRSLFSKRVEVRSSYGNAHLGHVFEDGPQETGGLRYCINSASLRFIPKDQMEQEGYGEWLDKVK